MNTILVVDDAKVNLEVVEALLSQNYHVLTALDATRAFELLKQHRVDLILLDIFMPSIDGFGVCRLLKNSKKTREIPIIFLTAADDEDSIERAYVIGGSDYVTKPFRPKELKARVNREIQLQKLQQELMELATTDPMTQLYNRRYFGTISQELYANAVSKEQRLVLMILDIDKFKLINDSYGHSVGDKVIIHFANQLVAYAQRDDIVARFGGEEFVVLFSNTTLEKAHLLAQRIRKNIETTPLLLPTKQKIHFTVSIGVIEVDTQDEESIEDAIIRADDALYRAKNSGRNQVIISY